MGISGDGLASKMAVTWTDMGQSIGSGGADDGGGDNWRERLGWRDG